VYRVESSDLLRSRSDIHDSTNREIPYVWPGEETM